MPDKGKTAEEEVSDGLEEGKDKPDEGTAEGGKDGEKEVDELLGKTVKVGNREMKVSQLVDDHSGLQAEYTKSQQLLKDPESLKEYLKTEHNINLSEKTEVPSEGEPDDEMKEAIEGGKRAGFVHQSDLDERDRILVDRTKLEITLGNLEKPRILGEEFPGIDPKDLPEFTKFDIVKYMSDEGFRDPVKAYKDKFETEIKALEKKVSDGEKATFTEKPTSGTVKLPPGKSPGKMTEKETSDLMQSMLEGNENK